MLSLPLPNDAEHVLLHPPKAQPFFAKKMETATETEPVPVAVEVEPDDADGGTDGPE